MRIIIKKVQYAGGHLKQVYGREVYGKSIEMYGRRLKKLHGGSKKKKPGGSRLLCQDKIQEVFHSGALCAATGKHRHRARRLQKGRLHAKLWKKSKKQLPLTTAPLALTTRTWWRELGPHMPKAIKEDG